MDMDWVQPFYIQKSAWLRALGLPHTIHAHDRARATTVARYCHHARPSVLEFGCGDGGTAAALADLGYDVTAIELSSLRVAQAQEYTDVPWKGSLSVVEGDFYTIELPNRFDVICYWDGFGIGTDADQQQLLRRIAHEWVQLDGVVMIEVFNPLYWANEAGGERQFAPIGVTVHYGFDPLQYRFIERCIPDGDETKAIAQTIRCYAPSDLQLLVRGTGLHLVALEMAGEPVSPRLAQTSYTKRNPWWTTAEYLAILTRTE
jgi:SAM-dependent methyltransferase